MLIGFREALFYYEIVLKMLYYFFLKLLLVHDFAL